MGKRRMPDKLAEKLLTIRLFKQLTQGEVLRFVYPEIDQNHRGVISQFEKGRNQPPLIVLQRYAELAGIELEKLSDDTQTLPFTVSEAQLLKDRKRGRPQKIKASAENKNEKALPTLEIENKNQINQTNTQNEKGIEFEDSLEKNLEENLEENLEQNQTDLVKTLTKVQLSANPKLQSAVEQIMKNEEDKINFSAKLSISLLEEIDNLYWQQRCQLKYSNRKELSRNKLIELMLQIVLDDFQTHTKDSVLSLLLTGHFEKKGLEMLSYL